ncbi:MAG TPA: DUF4157 domain-containing protein, partial [Sphingomonas sp.]|nr:DUF4157 domain-containing protein [Sphingomonas sp.]
MTHRPPQQRPTATPDAAPAQRKAAGPAKKRLNAVSASLNGGPAVQRLATMAPNRTGMPDNLKAGVEAMSGMSLDHVRVHRNSSRPAQLNAHAFAQGSDIHLAPGQERHLPHEAWHVVQQAQGRVKPTMQMKGDVPVNDEAHLEHEADMMGAKALSGVGQRAAVEDEEVHQAVSATSQRAAIEDEDVHQAASATTQRSAVEDEDVHQAVSATAQLAAVEDEEVHQAVSATAQRAATEDEEVHQAKRQPLQRAAISTSHRPVVQRAGVKAEMKAGEASFNEFIHETAAIGTKRNEVATAIYNQYKPLKLGQRDHFTQLGDHKGVNKQYNQKIAIDKSKRLTHWTSNAVNGAARIYAELLAAMDYNSTVNVDLSEITFGKDTTTEPDVFPSNDTALEVKRIDSGAQGAVDGHITKVSQQLADRKRGPQKTDINTWVAKIQIDNSENPWPY